MPQPSRRPERKLPIQEQILREQHENNNLLKLLVKTLADLDASTAALNDSVKLNTQAIADLTTRVTSAPPQDFTPQDDAINAAKSAIDANTATIAAIAPAAAPAT